MLRIKEELNSTRSRLLSVFDGLSDDDLNWKPDDATWSISQIVQHIAMVEGASTQAIKLGLTQEPNFVPEVMPLQQVFMDRTMKVNTPEQFQPSTEPKTKAQLKEILHNSRETLLSALGKFIENPTVLGKTSPPVPHPVFGQISTEQWVTTVRLHEERHIKQIEELRELLQSR